jgi:hypothetical protein
MIEIRIPRDKLDRNFIYKLDGICDEFSLQAHITVIDTLPLPVDHITIEGKWVVEEKNSG